MRKNAFGVRYVHRKSSSHRPCWLRSYQRTSCNNPVSCFTPLLSRGKWIILAHAHAHPHARTHITLLHPSLSSWWNGLYGNYRLCTNFLRYGLKGQERNPKLVGRAEIIHLGSTVPKCRKPLIAIIPKVQEALNCNNPSYMVNAISKRVMIKC